VNPFGKFNLSMQKPNISTRRRTLLSKSSQGIIEIQDSTLILFLIDVLHPGPLPSETQCLV